MRCARKEFVYSKRLISATKKVAGCAAIILVQAPSATEEALEFLPDH